MYSLYQGFPNFQRELKSFNSVLLLMVGCSGSITYILYMALRNVHNWIRIFVAACWYSLSLSAGLSDSAQQSFIQQEEEGAWWLVGDGGEEKKGLHQPNFNATELRNLVNMCW